MSLSLIFPIKEGTAGFASYDDAESTDAIKQNLKMLLLCIPGEYPMDIKFGAGLPQFLFNLQTQPNESQLRSRITQQISAYMPYIQIHNLAFSYGDIDRNVFKLTLEFSISRSEVVELFELDLNL